MSFFKGRIACTPEILLFKALGESQIVIFHISILNVRVNRRLLFLQYGPMQSAIYRYLPVYDLAQ